MNPYFGVVTVLNVPVDQEDLMTAIAFNEFGCTGVQNINSQNINIGSVNLPDSLKVMSGGLSETDGQIIDDKIFKARHASLEFYFEGEKNEIEKKSKNFESLILENDYQVSFELRENIDWRDSYKKFFKTINLKNNLKVIPSWEKNSADEGEVVYIEPGMGFGTGGHETTSLCLDFLQSISLQGKKSLDLGCGSGILGIYLQKYKSFECDYVDVDQDALLNCEKNLSLNNLVARENIILRKDFQAKKYDVVIANILLPILKEEAELIKNCLSDDGVVLLSGILKSQVDELVNFYISNNIVTREIERYDLGDWSCVVMGNNESILR